MSPRFSSAPLLCALSMLLWAHTAAAREDCTVSEDPQFRGNSLVMECQNGKSIEGYLGGSLCGGSDREISVVGQIAGSPEELDRQRSQLLLGVPSYIAKVTGLPGREGYPLGQFEYGMAKRVEEGGRYDDGFQFPESAVGTTTTCSPGFADTTKWQFFCWYEANGSPGCLGDRSPQEMGYPYSQDPICRWRVKQGKTTYNPPKYTADDFEEIDAGEDPPGQTPGLCQQTKNYLNQWQYFDCLISVPTDDGPMCLCWGNRYICNDHVVIGSEYGICDAFDNFPNAQDCTGEECRCGGADRENQCIRTSIPPDAVGPENLPYRSYFRQYEGSYERKALTEHVPDDDAREDGVPVACYGFYDEFDPKDVQTTRGDFRCVIDMQVEERKETQQGKGSYLGKGGDANPPAADVFEEEQDSWWQLFAGGFSHLNPKQESLSVGLGNFAPAKALGTPQSGGGSQQNGWSLDALVRDIDDTGPLGTVTRWWHKQETAVSTLLTPPKLRLVHIPPWAMGLGSDQEVFGADPPNTDDLWTGDRERPIDDQIHAKEDLIGQILSYIHNTLFAVEEAPLPVLLPSGSPAEFRARAQALCSWYLSHHPDSSDCSAVTGRAKEVMDSLEQYARRIDEVRELRGQLTDLSAQLLESQKTILQPLYQWSARNLSIYTEYKEKRDRVLQLGLLWQSVTQIFNDFHEKTNAPWCMDQRFTTAIYSLLDPWLTTRPDNGNATEYAANLSAPTPPQNGLVGGDGELGGLAIGIPSLESIPVRPQNDVVMDLSVFNAIRAPLVLPVLKPVQVRLNLEQYAPPPTDSDAQLPLLPRLPSIEPIKAAVADATLLLPKFCAPESEGIEPDPDCPDVQGALEAQEPQYWSDAELAEVENEMYDIGTMLLSMNDRYQQFWDSLNPDDDDKKEEEKDKLKCTGWDSGVCRHVEMDLLERFTRIGSRPAVLLAEDYKATGTLRGFAGTCLPDDEACQILNPEEVYPRAGWQLTQASSSSSTAGNDAQRIRQMRTQLRLATMVEPIGGIDADTFPPYAVDPQDLTLIFETPGPIDLSPPASSASSAS